MTWVAVGVAAVGAAGSIYATNKAANAQKDAANQAGQLSQQNMLFQAGLQEPQRAIGYGALQDLGALYGYGVPAYQSLNQLANQGSGYGAANMGGGGGGLSGSVFNPLNLNLPGMRAIDGVVNKLDPISNAVFGGRKDPRYVYNNGVLTVDGAAGKAYGGQINLNDGTVTVYTPGTATRDEALSAQATAALRGGTSLSGGLFGRFGDALTQIQQGGYKWQDPAATNALGQSQTPGVQGPGSMSRFFASPDYQFRLSEGQRNVGNSWAAKGGAFSGNALKALNEFNSNLAAGEYGNYFNRLTTLAGLGSAATNNVANAATNNTNALMQTTQAAGDARASGVLGIANTATGALNSGLNNYLLMRGGYFGGGGGTTGSGFGLGGTGTVAGYNPWKPYAPGASTPGPWAPGP